MTCMCRKYCLEAIQLSEKLLKLSRSAHINCDDDRCLVLFGYILDSATKIRREAEKRLKNLEEETAQQGFKDGQDFSRNFKRP